MLTASQSLPKDWPYFNSSKRHRGLGALVRTEQFRALRWAWREEEAGQATAGTLALSPRSRCAAFRKAGAGSRTPFPMPVAVLVVLAGPAQDQPAEMADENLHFLAPPSKAIKL